MKMFLGEYSPNITEGSRIALPKKLREQISGDQVVLSKGFEDCIFVYDSEDWAQKAQSQVEKLSKNMEMPDLERYMYASATEASIDTQGRMVLPASLKDYAGIKKSTTVVGVGDHIEVWDREKWKAYMEKISNKLAAR